MNGGTGFRLRSLVVTSPTTNDCCCASATRRRRSGGSCPPPERYRRVTASILETIAPGTTLADLERVLQFVQTFHPVGVGARDLRECLLIQLKRIGKEQSLEYRIVDRHIDDLGKRRFPEIARRLGTPPEQIQRAANFIATLDPKPGQIFTPDPNNYVLPDVTVEKIGGGWAVSLNGEQIPHLRISNTYKDLMSQDKGGADVKDYIRDKIRSGKFLIKSIHQRQQTIVNIAKEIVNRQREFMEKGVAYLKPLTMVQVAEVVGVHETTVSRAVSGKYIETPQGIFEMKYFFTSGIQTSEGVGISNTSVKGMIAEMIRKEDTAKPLSDEEIVKLRLGQPDGAFASHAGRYRPEQFIDEVLQLGLQVFFSQVRPDQPDATVDVIAHAAGADYPALNVSCRNPAYWKAIALVAVWQHDDVLFDARQGRDVCRLVNRPVSHHF